MSNKQHCAPGAAAVCLSVLTAVGTVQASPRVESLEWLGRLSFPDDITPVPGSPDSLTTSFFMRGINNSGDVSFNAFTSGVSFTSGESSFSHSAAVYSKNILYRHASPSFVATGMADSGTVLMSYSPRQGSVFYFQWQPPSAPFAVSSFPTPVESGHAISAGGRLALTRLGDGFGDYAINERREVLTLSNIDYATNTANVAIRNWSDTTGNGIPDTWLVDALGTWEIDRGAVRDGGGPMLNNRRQITYNVIDSESTFSSAYLWHDGEISALPFEHGAAHQRVYGLNNSGQIVGEAGPTRGPGRTAYLWQDDQSYSLNDLAIDALGGDTLWTAHAISHNGWITGLGSLGMYRMKLVLDEVVWEFAADGLFNRNDRWLQRETPSEAQTAVFREAGEYTVAFASSQTHAGLRLTGNGGHVTFALGTMSFGDDGGFANLTTHDPDAGIVELLSAPVAAPNTGVTVTRHTYALDHGTIGYAAGDATSLRVIDGSLLFNESLTIGQQGNGTLIIDGEGAQLSANQGAVIAEDGYGLLWIREGGEADITKKIVLGRSNGATGNILLENEHSSVVLQGDLTVGESGIGSVSVLHGGIFELEELLDDDGETVADGKAKVAAQLGSQGRILVSGEDSAFVSEGGLTLGDKGNGTLEIAQAGR
jgi:T5SS/PEP-CTERM-associated repeat protein